MDEKENLINTNFDDQHQSTYHAFENLSETIKSKITQIIHQNNLSDITYVRDLTNVPIESNNIDIIHSLQRRGKSFVDGALLILNNLEEKMIQQPIKNNQQNTMNELIKKNIHDAYDTFENSVKKNKKSALDTLLNELVLQINVAEKNKNQTLSADPKTIYQWLIDAENLVNWTSRTPDITISKTNTDHTIIQIEKPICNLSEEQKNEYLSIFNKGNEPRWFEALPLFAKVWLKNTLQPVIEGKKEINEALGTLPTTIRKFPGLANFSEHYFLIFDKQENCIFDQTTPTLRTSTLVPYQAPEEEHARLTEMNINQCHLLYPNNKLNLHSLVSPAGSFEEQKSGFNYFLAHPIQCIAENITSQFSDNETHMVRKIYNATTNIKTEKNRPISFNNRPVNSPNARIFCELLSDNKKLNETYALDFLENSRKTLKNAITSNQITPDQSALALHAINEYEKTISSNPSAGEDKNPHLYLSALEACIESFFPNNISQFMCKSGKDRTALTLIFKDSQRLYMTLYNKIPLYNDTPQNRKNFITLFCHLLLTHHHAYNSDKNAAGSTGLKSITQVLPQDIKDEINRLNPDFFQTNKLNSSLNKLKITPPSTNEINHAYLNYQAFCDKKEEEIMEQENRRNIAPGLYTNPLYEKSLSFLKKDIIQNNDKNKEEDEDSDGDGEGEGEGGITLKT